MKLGDEQLEAIRLVANIAEKRSVRACLVGGVVRDILRGNPAHDFDLDFLIEGDATSFAEDVYSQVGGDLKKFPSFFTAKITGFSSNPRLKELDFASTRSEKYESPAALPTVSLSTLDQDLKRRDFTTNAMAIELHRFLEWIGQESDRESLRGKVIDLYGGIADLDMQTIRILHEQSFVDDPTRLFRALRYQYRLGGTLDAQTEHLFNRAVLDGYVRLLSTFRVGMEIKKILYEESPAAIIKRAIANKLIGEVSFIDHEILSKKERYIDRLDLFKDLPEVSRLALFQIWLCKVGAGDRQETLLKFGFSKKVIAQILEVLKGGYQSTPCTDLQIISQVLEGEMDVSTARKIISSRGAVA